MASKKATKEEYLTRSSRPAYEYEKLNESYHGRITEQTHNNIQVANRILSEVIDRVPKLLMF